MNWLRRFMYGRYGFDHYSRALVFGSLFLSLIASFSRVNLIFLISYIPLVYAVFRITSKNIAKRTQENLVYCRIAESVKNKLRNIKLALIGTKTHKYYRCSHCKQSIRVPRGKGKICITCPKCKAEFIKRT
jgi:hypothetical protein